MSEVAYISHFEAVFMGVNLSKLISQPITAFTLYLNGFAAGLSLVTNSRFVSLYIIF